MASAGNLLSTTDVPFAIIQAVDLTIGHWYQNRQEVVVGRIATEIPMGAKYLLDQINESDN